MSDSVLPDWQRTVGRAITELGTRRNHIDSRGNQRSDIDGADHADSLRTDWNACDHVPDERDQGPEPQTPNPLIPRDFPEEPVCPAAEADLDQTVLVDKGSGNDLPTSTPSASKASSYLRGDRGDREQKENLQIFS